MTSELKYQGSVGFFGHIMMPQIINKKGQLAFTLHVRKILKTVHYNFI